MLRLLKPGAFVFDKACNCPCVDFVNEQTTAACECSFVRSCVERTNGFQTEKCNSVFEYRVALFSNRESFLCE
jgi:hypothetical protein